MTATSQRFEATHSVSLQRRCYPGRAHSSARSRIERPDPAPFCDADDSQQESRDPLLSAQVLPLGALFLAYPIQNTIRYIYATNFWYRTLVGVVYWPPRLFADQLKASFLISGRPLPSASLDYSGSRRASGPTTTTNHGSPTRRSSASRRAPSSPERRAPDPRPGLHRSSTCSRPTSRQPSTTASETAPTWSTAAAQVTHQHVSTGTSSDRSGGDLGRLPNINAVDRAATEGLQAG